MLASGLGLLVLSGGGGGQSLIRSLDHHAVFLLLLQLALLLFAARLLGEVARKLGQPSVIGELVAGVVLGPSVFGALMPELQAAAFPREQHQSDLLAVVSWLGVLSLLVVTGLETDLALIKRRGKSALVISAGGIIVPFITGLLLGLLVHDEYLADPDKRLVFALFMAVAMSISAVPVIAKVLMDLKLTRRDIGQLILASAMTDDTIGWILLSVVAGLATAGTVSFLAIVQALGGAAIFLLISFTVGSRVVGFLVTLGDRLFGGLNVQFSILLVLALGAAALTHYLGIEAVLGAFVIGILVAQAPRWRHETGHVLEVVTASWLAPIFFASAGVKVDLLRLADPEVMLVGALVLALACFGKFVGAYLGAWAAGTSHWERLAIGSGLNARGAMEIVVATVGLGLGVLSVEMYSIIVMVAVVTSVMAPPLLRFTLARVKVGADEAQRLEREAVAAASFVRHVRRILVVARTPRRMCVPMTIAAIVSGQQPIEATALWSRPRSRMRLWSWFKFRKQRRRINRTGLDRIRTLARRVRGPTLVRVYADKERAPLILTEAHRGHDLLVVGEVRRGNSRMVFDDTTDEVLRGSPCATLVVVTPAAAPNSPGEWWPKRVLVCTAGTDQCRHAVELAAVMATGAAAKLVVFHVARNAPAGREVGNEIVEEHARWAREFGADVETFVVPGNRELTGSVILQGIEEHGVDLVVMGAGLRGAAGRAFFGHRVEHILVHGSCPVAVSSTRP